jgi:hypothetical protein
LLTSSLSATPRVTMCPQVTESADSLASAAAAAAATANAADAADAAERRQLLRARRSAAATTLQVLTHRAGTQA